jgi:T5SS/PEP-CTERM-associated repeat protein
LVVGTQGNVQLTVETIAVLETPGYNVVAQSGTAEGTAVVEHGGIWHAGAGLTLGLRDSAKGYVLVYEDSSVDAGELYAGAQGSGYGQVGVYDGGILTVDQKLSLGDNDTAKGDLFVRRGGQVSASRIFLGGAGSGEGYITLTEAASKLETLSLAVGGTINNEGTSSSPGGIGGIGIQDGTIVVKNTLKLWNGSVFVNGVLKAGTIDRGGGTTFTTVGGSSVYSNRLLGFGDAPHFYGNLVLGHAESNGAAAHTLAPGQSLTVDANLTLGGDAQVNFWAYGAGTISSHRGFVAGLPGSDGAIARISDPGRRWNIVDRLDVGGAIRTAGGAGQLTVANGAVVEAASVKVWDHGTIDLDGGALARAGHVLVSGGRLQGTGLVQATSAAAVLTNAGVVSPGVPAALYARIHVSGGGDYIQTSLGALEIDLAGSVPGASLDVLEIDGSATLAGTLNVTIDAGFTPQLRRRHVFLTANDGVAGRFGVENLPIVASGVRLIVDYDATDVALVLTYDADFDEDGDVDGADLARWKANFGLSSGALHTQGDATGDHDVDGADLLVWQRQLGSGIVSTIAADATVPEPSGVALILGAALGFCPRRRRN